MSTDLEHIKRVYIESDLLFSEAEVQAAITRMARHITEQLIDSNPVVFTVMNGGLVIAGPAAAAVELPPGSQLSARHPLPQHHRWP